MTFLTILAITEILCSFRLVLEGKTGKEISESSRIEFLQKFSVKIFALSDVKDNKTKLLNSEEWEIFKESPVNTGVPTIH